MSETATTTDKEELTAEQLAEAEKEKDNANEFFKSEFNPKKALTLFGMIFFFNFP